LVNNQDDNNMAFELMLNKLTETDITKQNRIIQRPSGSSIGYNK